MTTRKAIHHVPIIKKTGGFSGKAPEGGVFIFARLIQKWREKNPWGREPPVLIVSTCKIIARLPTAKIAKTHGKHRQGITKNTTLDPSVRSSPAFFAKMFTKF